jgi:chlorite dismutase
MARPTPVIEKPDISEHGSPKDGQPQTLDRRLFMQLMAFTDCDSTEAIVQAVSALAIPAVVYEDLNDPHGIALLTMAENPGDFLDIVRPALKTGPFAALTLRPELTMLGRTYSLGYEPDLEETLFTRPKRTALNAAWPWAIWYPLRRKGEFMKVPDDEARRILMEHGIIGRSFGESDYAHDIRLACHGLDQADNDFVIGLMGKELYPLSAIVQAMRRTQQTSMYLASLGPFFVGRALWQSST